MTAEQKGAVATEQKGAVATDQKGPLMERRKKHQSSDDTVQRYHRNRRMQFAIVILLLHFTFIILFGVFIRYTPHQSIAVWNPADLKDAVAAEKLSATLDFGTSGKFDVENGPEKNPQFIDVYYPMFEDVQVMVFIGFGFLIAFMRFFCLTAITMNFLFACFALEWALLINGWFDWARHPERHVESIACGWGMGNHHDMCTGIDIATITNALFGCTTVLISLGALLGKITPTQMVINALLEIVVYGVNRWIILGIIEASDAGHAMSVHAFGAFWGVAASCVLWPKKKKLAEAPGAKEAYANELFVFIGTLFLFCFWPSWNAAQEMGMERHRAVVNSFLAMLSSCITTFAISAVFDKQGRFTVQHLQNATLAGGVGIGSIASAVVHPFGALLIGMFAGAISCFGYQYLTPALNRIGAHDSAGVLNLHGIPGVYASVVSAIVAGSATIVRMGSARAEIAVFNAMAPLEARQFPGSDLYVDPAAKQGDFPEYDRTQTRQGGMQFVAILITIALSVAGGILSGVILRFVPMDDPAEDKLGEDSEFFLPHWEELGGDDAPLHAKSSMHDMRMQGGESEAESEAESEGKKEHETKFDA